MRDQACGDFFNPKAPDPRARVACGESRARGRKPERASVCLRLRWKPWGCVRGAALQPPRRVQDRGGGVPRDPEGGGGRDHYLIGERSESFEAVTADSLEQRQEAGNVIAGEILGEKLFHGPKAEPASLEDKERGLRP